MLLELSLLGCLGLSGLEILKTLNKNSLDVDSNQEKEKLYEEYPIVYSDSDEEGVQIATNYYIQNNSFYRDAMYLNSMVIGSPGSWKSTVGIYPNLLNKKLRGTLIINDPKGEFYKSTSKIQKSFGRKVKRISFNEIDDKINILRELNNEDDIFEFSKTIMINGLSENSAMSQDANTWVNLSATLLTSLLCYVKYYGEEEKNSKKTDNITEALLLLQLVEDEVELENILKNNDLAYKYFLSFKSGGGKTSAKSNILLNINSALAIYLSSSVREITSETTINLNDIRTNEYAIYICGDEIGSSKMSPVITPILQLFLKKSIELGPTPSMSEKNKKNILDVHFFLDEFGNMGKINNLNQYLTMMREYRVNMYMVLQSFSQLNNTYTNSEVGAIMSGIGHILFLTNNKEHSTVSKLMEMSSSVKKEFVERECSEDGSLIKVKKKYVDYNVISENEASSIKKGEGILFVGSQDIMKIKFNRWFEEDRYSSYENLITNTVKANANYKKPIVSHKSESFILNAYREAQLNNKASENVVESKEVTNLKEIELVKEVALTKDVHIRENININKQKIKNAYNKFLEQNF